MKAKKYACGLGLTGLLGLMSLGSSLGSGQALAAQGKWGGLVQSILKSRDRSSYERRLPNDPKQHKGIEVKEVPSSARVTNSDQFQQLQNGVPITGVAAASSPGFRTWTSLSNQPFIVVPPGALNLRFTLSGSPTSSDIDLAIRLNQPVDVINGQLIRDFISESAGSFEEISIQTPTAGNWYAAVGNTELFSVSFTLVASYSAGSTILQIDDGGFENAIGYSTNGASQAYFVNRLTPLSYPATLASVLIYFGSGSQRLSQGFPVTILVGTNTGGSSNIDGVFFRRTQSSISFIGAFNEYTVDPVTISSGDFVVGFVTSNPVNTFPADVDTTSPRARSYTSTDGFNFRLLENLGGITPGNFGIRARVRGIGCPADIVLNFSSQQVNGFVSPGRAVDYAFDPIPGARYRFSTCDGFANFDTLIQVFQNGILVAQNDDCFFPFELRSAVEVTFSASGCGVVRMRGATPSATGSFGMIYRRTF